MLLKPLTAAVVMALVGTVTGAALASAQPPKFAGTAVAAVVVGAPASLAAEIAAATAADATAAAVALLVTAADADAAAPAATIPVVSSRLPTKTLRTKKPMRTPTSEPSSVPSTPWDNKRSLS
jgi:hypothetical protein